MLVTAVVARGAVGADGAVDVVVSSVGDVVYLGDTPYREPHGAQVQPTPRVQDVVARFQAVQGNSVNAFPPQNRNAGSQCSSLGMGRTNPVRMRLTLISSRTFDPIGLYVLGLPEAPEGVSFPYPRKAGIRNAWRRQGGLRSPRDSALVSSSEIVSQIKSRLRRC